MAESARRGLLESPIGLICILLFGLFFLVYVVLEYRARVHRKALTRAAEAIHGQADARDLAPVREHLAPLISTSRLEHLHDRIEEVDGRARSIGSLRSVLPDEAVSEQIKPWFTIPYTFTRALPTAFTTVGMLGTFLGIADGLGHISGAQGVDVANEVGSVVSGLSAAFWTSILGLSLALATNLINHVLHGHLLAAFDSLREALDHFAPPISNEELLNRPRRRC